MVDELSPAERRALEAWPAMAPPPGFAERVIAARGRPRRIAALAFAGAMVAAAATLFVVLRPAGPAPLATVVRADGPLDIQRGRGAWQEGRVGDRLHRGDAIRTAEHRAELTIRPGAKLAMERYTLLRFEGTTDSAKLRVELGAIELAGSGSYALDLGTIRLDGRVQITGDRAQTIELLAGNARVETLQGDPIELALGRPIDLSIGVAVVVPPVDAGVAPTEPADPAVGFDGDTLEIIGPRAEVQNPGDTTWAKLPEGVNALTSGSRLRMGARTHAAVRMRAGELDLVAGPATITATGSVRITVPGGVLVLDGTHDAPTEATVEANGRQTRVAMRRGTGVLRGARDAELALVQGTTASVTRTGALRELVRVPTYFDLRVSAGESFTIHDPRGKTAVQIAFASACTDGGTLEVDRDMRFRSPRTSAGPGAANVMLSAGAWAYRVRCHERGEDGPTVASGRVIVRRDSGRRPLPKRPAVNPIDADGRNYRISYQSVIPTVAFRHPRRSGKTWTLHLATGGTEQTFEATKPVVEVPGTKLAERTYTYWFDIDGVKDAKVATLTIDFDQTAPQVYIEAPLDGRPWADTIDVRGAVAEGWTPSIDGVTIPIDRTRRFMARVGRPGESRALAIKATHAQRGVHYYLRRP